ncbi:hypothetical protein [Nocardioides bizhenqiangii]|uniref:Lipoprotein n=1 Tax=Nocardioides bizhenqiangii TaxID=3095076 RepID=A0ABZ0ZLU7_9ACTN|nr:hypothetical protein [Nocardioides sp. HM61]WQQ25316.1 hypothetical protein SHK19_15255 [Nocardioides sp. HM61]
MRRFLGTVLLASVAALTGCTDEETAKEPSAQTSSTSPTETSEESEDEPLSCVARARPFSGAAADRFGAETVMAAYCSVAELSLETAFGDLLVPGPHRAGEFEIVEPWLSERGQRVWSRAVRGALEGDAAAERRVDALTLHSVAGVPDRFQLADDPPPAFGTEVGPGEAGLRGDRLLLSFDVTTGIVLERAGDDQGQHLLWSWTKHVRFVVSRSADGWLVDDWSATWSRGDVAIVTGG